MSQEGDLPFNEETIGRYPFRPEDKGWPTKMIRKREEERW